MSSTRASTDNREYGIGKEQTGDRNTVAVLGWSDKRN